MSAPPLTTVRAADVAAASVSWLWPSYLPRGKLAILDGDPGTGKSFVTLDLAARVTRGLPMPDGGAAGPPASVLVLSAEDGADDTIRPRAAAGGADLERLHIVSAPGLAGTRLAQFPDDVAELGRLVREFSAALVVIDPMTAFLPPRISANSDQCIRSALSPLAALAAATGVVILFVRHLRKLGGPTSLYRGAGSMGIAGAVRSGLLVARHPDDPDLGVLSVIKPNLGAPGKSLGFRLAIDAASGGTVVRWCGPLDITADDLCGATPPARAGGQSRERAAEWLRAFLADGPRRAEEVYEAAHQSGIAERTLMRVKASLGVKSEAEHEGDRTVWYWRDPKAPKPAPECDDLLPPLEVRLDPLPPLEPRPDGPPPRPRDLMRMAREIFRKPEEE